MSDIDEKGVERRMRCCNGRSLVRDDSGGHIPVAKYRDGEYMSKGQDIYMCISFASITSIDIDIIGSHHHFHFDNKSVSIGHLTKIIKTITSFQL